MTSYEPASGYNLPPGCFERDIDGHFGGAGQTCGDCRHLLEGCCDFGICELEFEEAFEEQQARERLAAWEAAEWAFGWIVDHYKDMQEDSCPKWEEWRK